MPHRDISLAIFLIVEEALRFAWNLMRTKPRTGFNLIDAHEDEITHELRERLYNEVFNKHIIDGFDRQLFMVVVREAKVDNYNGGSIDKMPDMIIMLWDDTSQYIPSQDGIFIECKPVDHEHSLVTHYCKKGISRFVVGDYAWTMTSALMIGYVSNGYNISSNLSNAFKKIVSEIKTIDYPCSYPQSIQNVNHETVYVSRHLRNFQYVQTGQQAPPIAIHHLWLHRD